MKPRPRYSAFAFPTRPIRAAPNTQCHRNVRPITITASSLICQPRHSRPRTSTYPTLHASHDAVRLYASSATAKAAKPPSRPRHANAPSLSPKSPSPQDTKLRLNPPPETHAPELKVPPRGANQSYPGYLFAAGKAYIAFYKTGIAHVRATAKTAKQLRARVSAAQKANNTAQPADVLTRAQWQIVRRSRADMLRLPPFGILVLLMGEWLPLLAMYITPLIPEPCRIPQQVARTREKLEARRRERERRVALDAPRLVGRGRRAGEEQGNVMMRHPAAVGVGEIEGMGLLGLLALSSKVDAHSKIWDMLFLTPPKGVLKWGLLRKSAYLRTDDGLIQRDGGFLGLEEKEIERACMERGIYVSGKKEGELRAELKKWFEVRAKKE